MRRLKIQPLESRDLLAADPLITEFVADKNGGRLDEDGDSSDWLEIANVGTDPIDLTGWHLTDNAQVLDLWDFPTTTLDAGEHVVVFASGKLRAGTGPTGEHHTNFQLDAAGDYLALVEPDGMTVASEFAPQFPSQSENYSYGLQFTRTDVSLVQSADAVQWIVPASSNDLPSDWADPGFDTAGWNSGGLGIGYDRPEAVEPDVLAGLRLWLKADDIVIGDEPVNGSLVDQWRDVSGLDHHATTVTDFTPAFTAPVRQEITVAVEGGTNTVPVVRFSGGVDELLRADDIVAGPDGLSEAAENANFNDVTVIGVYKTAVLTGNNRPFGFGTSLADNRGGQNSNNFHIANDPSIRKDNGNVGAGSYSQTVPTELLIRSSVMTADNGGSVTEFFNGEQVLSATANYSIRSDNFFLGDIRFPTGDSIDVAEVIVFDRALPANERESIEQYLETKYFALSAGSGGSTGPYTAFFETDLADEMQDANASVLLRSEFDVTAPSELNLLRLNMQYDDGFVAYLNGVEVARRNAPVVPMWNSVAAADRPDESAIVTEEINLTLHLSLLQETGNVLAIHGLNVAVDDEDFLMVPELLGINLQGSELRYFEDPTPGLLNENGRIGFVADTQFSVDRGFFDESFQVEITSITPAAEIHYTTDGSLPSETNGTLYSGPISIGQTTTLRAIATKTAWFSSNVDTHSYFFLEDVLTQTGAGFPGTWGPRVADYEVDPNVVNHPLYADTFLDDLRTIPTMSLVMDTEDLFGVTGIYSNTQGRGIEWERVASVEYILPDGSTGFQEDSGLRIWGFGSRNSGQPKHGLRLLFKKGYGEANLNYPLFSDSSANQFDNIVLRATNAKSWTDTRSEWNAQAQYIRDSWGRDTMSDMGHPSSHSTYVHLYLNGLYWGLYNPVERPDGSFMARYFGGDEDDYDAINTRTGTLEATNGDLAAWNELIQLVEGDVSTPAALDIVGEHIDLENMIDYFNIYFYAGARDWVGTNGNNMRVASSRGDDSQFIAFPWDFENTFWDATDNNLNVVTQHDTLAKIHAALLSNPEYLTRFSDRVQTHFFNGGALTPEVAAARWMERATEIDRAVVGESARWGDTRTEPPRTWHFDWIPEQDRLLTQYFPQRSDILLQQYRAAGLYSAIDAPLFNEHGGVVSSGFELVIENVNPTGTIYYTLDGSDPRLVGDGISAIATEFTTALSLTAGVEVTARVLDGNVWSAVTSAQFQVNPLAVAGDIVVSEFHYNPAGPTSAEMTTNSLLDNDDFEFIELQNIAGQTVDLFGVQFVSGIEFEFDNVEQSTLAPGERIVIVRNLEAFELRNGVGLPVVGEFASGSLANSGERVTLLSADGNEIVSYEYDDRLPWPIMADGYSFSLELMDPLSNPDHSDPQSWQASGSVDGSPGAESSQTVTPILIRELLTHTDIPEVDAVELFNPTNSDVDVGGWYLSDNDEEPLKFVIPPNTMIPAQQAIVIWEDDDGDPLTIPPAEFFGGAFSLSSLGEEVLLTSATSGQVTGYTHGFEFGAAENGRSFIRHVDSIEREHFTAQAGSPGTTLNADNDSFLVGDVVITELHYNPNVSDLNEAFVDEFVEVQNRTSGIVDLFDAENPMNTWKINGVGFSFPPNTSLAPNEIVLVVAIAPAEFRNRYQIDPATAILGPYPGSLNNGGERVSLQRPDTPSVDQVVPFIDVDVVRYDDRAPWPRTVDGENGDGSSLTRTETTNFGSDPASWLGAEPSPGDIVSFGVISVSMNANEVNPADLNGMPQPTSWQQQRSLVRDISIEFTFPIVLDAASVELVNLGVDAPQEIDEVQVLDPSLFSAEDQILNIDLSNFELPDGVYQLTIQPTLLSQGGIELDGNGDGVAGDAFVLIGNLQTRFYKMAADWNGDTGVSVFDFTTFSYWFGQAIPVAPRYADSNKDGGVSVFDFTIFSANFGTGVVFSSSGLVAFANPSALALGEGAAGEPPTQRVGIVPVWDAAIVAWTAVHQRCNSFQFECVSAVHDGEDDAIDRFWNELELRDEFDFGHEV